MNMNRLRKRQQELMASATMTELSMAVAAMEERLADYESALVMQIETKNRDELVTQISMGLSMNMRVRKGLYEVSIRRVAKGESE